MARDQISFRVININLKSQTRKGEEAYSEIIETLFKNKIYEKVAADRSAILRTQNKAVFGQYVVYYGYIGKFTTIDSPEWLNLINLEKEKFEIPQNLFPNIKETYYIFAPAFHRLAILESQVFSVKIAKKYLDRALNQTLKSGEKIDVIIEQDIDEFRELLNAVSIKRLELEITYSNSDITDDSEKLMDDQLKRSGVGNMKMVVTPDASDNIKIKESQVLTGLTQLSGSNGNVKARVVTSGGRTKTIDTKKHELKLKTHIEDDNIFRSVLNKMVNVFITNKQNKKGSGTKKDGKSTESGNTEI